MFEGRWNVLRISKVPFHQKLHRRQASGYHIHEMRALSFWLLNAPSTSASHCAPFDLFPQHFFPTFPKIPGSPALPGLELSPA